MSKTNIEKDFATKTLTVSRAFAAPRSLVWQYCTGGEKQAQWWGPEGWPATSVHHDFTPGGYWHYFMKGPDGTEAHGRMDYVTVDAENSYDGLDAFCDQSGAVNTDLPRANVHAEFTEQDGMTTFSMTTTYASAEDMQKVIDMGVEAGIGSALDNLEKALAQAQA